MTQLQFKIYVGDLADYNGGNIRGIWLDLTELDWDEIEEQIQKMLKEKNHEEWFIQDYETNVGFILDKYENIEELCEKVECIKDVDAQLLKQILEAGYITIDTLDSDFLIEDYRFVEAFTPKELGELEFYYYHDELDAIDSLQLLDDSDLKSDPILRCLAENFSYENYGKQLIMSGEYIKIAEGYIHHML